MRLPSLVAALSLVGCASQGDEGMSVINNTAVVGSECSLSGDAAQPFTAHGEIWAFAKKGYFLTPLIQSRVTGTGGGSAGTDDVQRTIQLRGADIKLTVKATTVENADGSFTTAQPERALSPFSVLFSGSLPPGGTVNVGFDVITPAQMRDIVTQSGIGDGQELTAEVLAEITVKGDLGGDEITAAPFLYPISVCTDCVVIDLGTCPAVVTVPQGNGCNIFQDGSVGCCTDASDNFVCPAPTM